MPRGVKVCPDCGTVTGPRAFQCSQCGHKFDIRHQSKSVPVSVPTSKSDKIKTAGDFNIGSKVKLVSEWLPKEAKGKRGTIARFQKNPSETFAVVQWKHSAEFGDKFPLHELELVE